MGPAKSIKRQIQDEFEPGEGVQGYGDDVGKANDQDANKRKQELKDKLRLNSNERINNQMFEDQGLDLMESEYERAHANHFSTLFESTEDIIEN